MAHMTTGRALPTLNANAEALERLFACGPRLVSVSPAADVIPGMEGNRILTSGPDIPFASYTGGQRDALLGAAIYEGFAADHAGAEKAFATGEVVVSGCQRLGAVGSLAGVTTASMPVVVVEDPQTGDRAFCTLYEGDAVDRLNYGVFSSATRENLDYLRDHVGPALDRVVRRAGGVKLKPIIQRALTMGDELHSRNTAATTLFTRQMLGAITQASTEDGQVLSEYFSSGDYFFLRLAMAAAKVMANTMRGIPGCSIVTSMAFSCREFGIQVSGAGDQWFRGPLPTFEATKLNPGFSPSDIEFMGGESTITEVVGLGGVAQAAALPLQRASGGNAAVMIARTEQMYRICAAEHRDLRIPVLDYRGVPVGFDVRAIAETGITPVLDIGIAGVGGGQIGGGVARAPIEPFLLAAEAIANS
ncbi:hypothetical protein R1CP_36645 (plasmid) [Rhodococcus opacus]|uniref:DUF1116 domain-containing protein n=1 Tax=Rhodococcus opacus TaxID=37919 RepID=A0A1B1KH45_RHOOP|nr:DUF1116 domain-containing protein [Rhodococcus opacus]ANS31935.1 hypothetical protein R1CP_36645 [Rhodococcus opacus]